MFLVLYTLTASAQDVPDSPDPTAAPADADKERAKELFQNATILYEEGNYEASLSALEQANELYPNPALNFNIANCLERLGRYDEAIASMDQYRASATADERATLDRRIRAMEKRRDEEAAATPAPSPDPMPVVEPVPTTKSGPRWLLVGGGGALAIAGGVGAAASYGSAQKNLSDLDRSGYDSSRTLNTISLIGAGVGVGVAALGVVLPRKRVTLTAQAGATGGQLRVGGAW